MRINSDINTFTRMFVSSYQTLVYSTDLSVLVENKKYSEFSRILQD